MFLHDLNTTYEYEQRRDDERRAAAQTELLRQADGKRKVRVPSPAAMMTAIFVLLVVLLCRF